jgi:hypothetical protein
MEAFLQVKAAVAEFFCEKDYYCKQALGDA